MMVASRFQPAWWAHNAHLQTVWQSLFRLPPNPSIRRERLELDDGDFMDLDWVGPGEGPLTLLLHGLEGSVDSRYAGGQLRRLASEGMRGVLMHFRGCSGEPNRLRRGYHSGVSDDLQRVIDHIRQSEPDTPLAVAGYSLGGNVLLKWLGENGDHAPVVTGVAVSIPFRLDRCADYIATGTSRIYNHYLMRRMRESYARKFADRNDAPFPVSERGRLRHFRDFDDAITAPLHGFADAADYYRQASSFGYLDGIRRPCLILQARDDPFMPPDILPDESRLSDSTRLEISDHGGHVGFVTGRLPWRPTWWLEERITQHIRNAFDQAGVETHDLPEKQIA